MSTPPVQLGLPPGIAEIRGIERASSTERAARTDRTDLGDAFGQALAEARVRETTATEAAQRFADGDPSIGIHEVMIAAEKASISVRYATTLKNKAVEAYRELMNTQV
ncbi:MAG: flagellar hook-basal body complex protein FliE [Kofleriaceae bacterium]